MAEESGVTDAPTADASAAADAKDEKPNEDIEGHAANGSSEATAAQRTPQDVERELNELKANLDKEGDEKSETEARVEVCCVPEATNR